MADNHKAVHRLSQVYADLILAENELEGLVIMDSQANRKLRLRLFIREAASVVKHVVDTDLGKQLIKENDNG